MKLEAENIFLAQVDCTVEKTLASKYKVRGYPTLKYFQKGKDIDYSGGRTEASIENWMRKRASGNLITELKDANAIEEFKKKNNKFLVYFGDDKDHIKVLEDISNENDDFTFAKNNDEAAMKKYEVTKGKLVLFKDFETKKDVFNDKFLKDNILGFAYGFSYPPLMKIDMTSVPVIFHKGRSGLILFRENSSPDVKKLYDLMKSVGYKVRHILPVCYSDIKSSLEKELVSYVDVDVKKLPQIKIADTKGKIKKYTYTGELEVDKIVQFVLDWKEGKLKDDDTLKKEQKAKDTDTKTDSKDKAKSDL